MFGLGPTELVIIAVILLLIFGAKRLPEIGKGLGGAIREFRDIKKNVNPGETTIETSGDSRKACEQNGSMALEAQIAEKVMEQVPGVKRVVGIKKKAEKIKELVK